MTKKHFEAIAKIMKRYYARPEWYVKYSGNSVQILLNELINELADYMQDANPRFDRDRFTKACIS
jgi:hypothetical protein